MTKKFFDGFSIVLILVIIVAVGLLILQNTIFNSSLSVSKSSPRSFGITGHATEDTTVSNVSVQRYLSIALCINLSDGIQFGDVATLPATNINGSHNYDIVDDSNSSYCVNISTDSNTAIDVCLRADGDLTNPSSDAIGIQNETYSNYTSTNSSHPLVGSEASITTGYLKSGLNIGAGNVHYYRFWLDVPAAQPSGDYNNTIYFKGVTTTLSCS